jgi:hypothetical protein
MYQGSDSVLSYSHYNQSIAHSMGANFREYLAIINYQWKRIYASYKFNFTQAGYDFVGNLGTKENYGNNILRASQQTANDGSVTMFNGTAYNILNNEFRVGYILNPKINLVAELRLQLRNYTSNSFNFSEFNSHNFGFSIYTNIFNRYYDLPVLY